MDCPGPAASLSARPHPNILHSSHTYLCQLLKAPQSVFSGPWHIPSLCLKSFIILQVSPKTAPPSRRPICLEHEPRMGRWTGSPRHGQLDGYKAAPSNFPSHSKAWIPGSPSRHQKPCSTRTGRPGAPGAGGRRAARGRPGGRLRSATY